MSCAASGSFPVTAARCAVTPTTAATDVSAASSPPTASVRPPAVATPGSCTGAGIRPACVATSRGVAAARRGDAAGGGAAVVAVVATRCAWEPQPATATVSTTSARRERGHILGQVAGPPLMAT